MRRYEPCPHRGCPVRLRPDYLKAHEAQLHVICTCGRSFTEAGLSRHLAQVRRFPHLALEHPPLPRWSLGKRSQGKVA